VFKNKIFMFHSIKKEINSFYRRFNLNYSFVGSDETTLDHKIQKLKAKCLYQNKINYTRLKKQGEPINSLLKMGKTTDLISSTIKNGILLWSENGILKENISNHIDLNGCTKIISLRYSFIACSISNYIKLIRIYNNFDHYFPKIERTVYDHNCHIKTIINLDDNYIGLIDENQEIFVIEPKYGNVILSYRNSRANSISSLSNEHMVASFDDRISMFELTSGIEKSYSNIKNADLVLELVGGILIYTSKKTFDIFIFDLINETIKSVLSGHLSQIKSLLRLNESYLASGSDDGTIIVWDVKKAESIQLLNVHENAVISLEILKNGNLISGSVDGSIIIWNNDFN
jgi:WD40 repeat protein